MSAAGRALRVAALLGCLAAPAEAQDTATVEPRALPLDTTRLGPFRSAFDVLARSGDSSLVIGRRTLTCALESYAGAPAWLLVETRTGAVASVESLYVSPAMRPLHWSSALGASRLAIEFARDSIFGATSGPAGRQNIVLAGGPDLLVSIAMTEALLPLVAFTPYWSDSVSVLAIDNSGGALVRAELTVIGEEQLAINRTAPDSLAGAVPPLPRPAWIVALRAPARTVLFWVDRETGALLRLQQPIPIHGASLLEYRRVSSDSVIPSGPR